MSEKADEPVGGRDRGRVSPRAAFVLSLVLAAAGVAYLRSQSADVAISPPTDPPLSPSASLAASVDAEVEFERLEDLTFRAFEQKDLSLVKTIYTADSPVRKAAVADIRRLRRDSTDVVVDSRTTRLRVNSVSDDEIRLRQHVLISLTFFDGDGRDVTRGSGRERQKIDWVLRREGDTWLIHDSVIVFAHPCGPKPQC